MHLGHKRELGACKSMASHCNSYIVWSVTGMLHDHVRNPDIKIHSLSLITALSHLRGAGICWILRNRYCHEIGFQEYEGMLVSPAREIVNEAGEYRFPEANYWKASTHEITNKVKSRYNGFKLPLVNIKRIAKEALQGKNIKRTQKFLDWEKWIPTEKKKAVRAWGREE